MRQLFWWIWNKNYINNKLLKAYRFDLILTLLSDQSKLEELEIKNANDVNELRTKFKNLFDYGLFECVKNMENAEIFNQNTNEIYLYQRFTNILLSPIIINLYKDILY